MTFGRFLFAKRPKDAGPHLLYSTSVFSPLRYPRKAKLKQYLAQKNDFGQRFHRLTRFDEYLQRVGSRTTRRSGETSLINSSPCTPVGLCFEMLTPRTNGSDAAITLCLQLRQPLFAHSRVEQRSNLWHACKSARSTARSGGGFGLGLRRCCCFWVLER